MKLAFLCKLIVILITATIVLNQDLEKTQNINKAEVNE